MRTTARLLVVLVSLAALGTAKEITYTVKIADPSQKTFQVEMSIPAAKGRLRLFLPNYTPGSLLQNNSRYVVGMLCSDAAGHRVAVHRVTEDEWEVQAPAAAQILVMSYEVVPNSADALRLTTNSLGPHGGFFHGTTLFLGVEGRLHDATALRLQLPAGWKTATVLDGRDGAYHAPDYRTLVLAPVQFGEWTERQIHSNGVSVRLLFDAPLPAYDEKALDQRLTGILDHHVRLFGGAPFHELLVLFHWRPDLQYGGGVARRSAIVMNIGRDWMPELSANLAGTFAHELFHAWNFAAFYPQARGGSFLHDHDSDDGDRFTWFIEGVTNYYVLRTFSQIGKAPRQSYLDWMSNDITELENSSGRPWMSLEEAGTASWVEPVASVPLPDGGEVAGLLLDLAIRRASHDRRSLDDVLRRLYQESKAPGYQGYTTASFRRAINETAGADLSRLLDRLVSEKGPYDYAAMLQNSGLSVAVSGQGESKEYKLQVAPSLTPEERETIGAIFSDR